MKASSVLALSLTCWLTALVGCSEGDSGTEPTSPPAAAGSASGGKAGATNKAGAPSGGQAGSKTGSGGTSSGGSSSGAGGAQAGEGGAGEGGSSSGAGGSLSGSGGSLSGAGGSPSGAGGSTAGAGGTTAGSGGTTAGAGGMDAGAGGSAAGSGGATAGSGGAATAGAGGSPGGAGTPTIVVGKITGATSEEVTMIAEGVQLANTTMATACFKDFVLAAKWTETEGLSQEQIWQKLCAGPVQVDVDMYLGSWYQNHVSKTIGYEDEPGVVHMNRYFVDTPYAVADNIIHEAEGHSQGFSHYGVKATSVPYGLNDAFEQCSPVDP